MHVHTATTNSIQLLLLLDLLMLARFLIKRLFVNMEAIGLTTIKEYENDSYKVRQPTTPY